MMYVASPFRRPPPLEVDGAAKNPSLADTDALACAGHEEEHAYGSGVVTTSTLPPGTTGVDVRAKGKKNHDMGVLLPSENVESTSTTSL
jgi:hypothetical protein